MRVRLLTVAAAAALAVTGLAACDSKVGAAGFVGSRRISETTVTKYVKPGAKPFTTQDSTGASSTIVPKSYVLQDLIVVRLLGAALTQHGGPATDAELNAAQAQVLNGTTVAQLQQTFAADGFQPQFTALYLAVNERIQVLAKRVNSDSNGTQILAALRSLDLPVQVSGRYGTWDETNVQLADMGTGAIPDFLHLTSAAPSPTPTSAG